MSAQERAGEPTESWARSADVSLLRDFSPALRARSFHVKQGEVTAKVGSAHAVGANTSGWGEDRKRREIVAYDKEMRNAKPVRQVPFNAGPGAAPTVQTGLGYSRNVSIAPKADIRARNDKFAYASSFADVHTAPPAERARGASRLEYTLPFDETGATHNRPFRPPVLNDDSDVARTVAPVNVVKESPALAGAPRGPVSKSSFRTPPLAHPEPTSGAVPSGRQYGETRFRPREEHKSPNVVHPSRERDLKVKYPVDYGYNADPAFNKKSSSLAKAVAWGGTADAGKEGAVTAKSNAGLDPESVSGYEDNFSHSAHLADGMYMKDLRTAEGWKPTTHRLHPSTLPINGGSIDSGKLAGIRIPGVVSGYEQGTMASPCAPLARPGNVTRLANLTPKTSIGVVPHARVEVPRGSAGEQRLLRHMKEHPYLYETRPGENLPPYSNSVNRIC